MSQSWLKWNDWNLLITAEELLSDDRVLKVKSNKKISPSPKRPSFSTWKVNYTKNQTRQRVAKEIIPVKSSSKHDIAKAIADHTVDYPHSPDNIIVKHIDISDMRQLDELQELIETLKEAKLCDKNIYIWLALSNDKLSEREDGFVNPEYSIIVRVPDKTFTTLTLGIFHRSNDNKEKQFNVEITESFDKETWNVIFKVSCISRDTWKALEIYTNSLKWSNINFDYYMFLLKNSSNKDQAYESFKRMLDYWFFNSELDRLFWIK